LPTNYFTKQNIRNVNVDTDSIMKRLVNRSHFRIANLVSRLIQLSQL